MSDKKNLVASVEPPMEPAQPPQVAPTVQQAPLTQQPSTPVTQIILQTRNHHPRVYGSFQSVRSRQLGLTMIICGVTAILANVIGIAFNATSDVFFYRVFSETMGIARIMYFVGAGIWCSISFVLCGSFALAAAKRRSRGFIITCLVMAIFSIVGAVIMFGFTTAILVTHGLALQEVMHIEHQNDQSNGDDQYDHRYYDRFSYNDGDDTIYKSIKGLMLVTVVFSLVSILELIAAIWTCVVCSKVICSSQIDKDEGMEGQVQFLGNQFMVLDRQGQIVQGAQVLQVPAGVAQVQGQMSLVQGQDGGYPNLTRN